MAATFRSYLDTLKKNNELTAIAKSVDLRDIAALVPQSHKALLFNNVRGYSMPVASGLLQSRSRLALALDAPYEKIESKIRAAMDHPINPKRVQKAPVKDVILTKNKVDLYNLPGPVFSVMDGGPMITAGVVIAEDPEFGMNAGMYRMMLNERNITGIDIVTPNNLRKFAERALQIVKIREGRSSSAPGGLPHSPGRFADTWGLVIERRRRKAEREEFVWFCEQCDERVLLRSVSQEGIASQVSSVYKEFNTDPALRSCRACGYIFPQTLVAERLGLLERSRNDEQVSG